MRLLKTIGSVDFTGQERAALNKLTMPHSGLSYLTPADVHYGRAATVLAARHRTRLAAYAAHPERFVHGPPRPETMPTAVWINRPPTLTRQVAPATTTVTPGDPQPGSMRPPPRIDNRPGTLVTSVESLQ